MNRRVSAGEQLTVDYRDFNFEHGCLCFECTGLTTYDELDYATSADRVCEAGLSEGLFTKRSVGVGTVIGFAVGNLLSLADAHGDPLFLPELPQCV